jgi:cell division protein ZapA (FtsZ GTPase activity inhibitor)
MSEGSGDRKTVTVEIAGEKHVLRSGASPEYTQSVAAHLDSTVIALGMGDRLDPHKAVILAALTITDELFRSRRELNRLRDEVARGSTRLAYMLERAAGEERSPDPPPGEA